MKKHLFLLVLTSLLALTISSCTKDDQNVFTFKLKGSYIDYQSGETIDVKLKLKQCVLYGFDEERQIYKFKNDKELINPNAGHSNEPDLWLQKYGNDGRVSGSIQLPRFTNQIKECGWVHLFGVLLNDGDNLSVSGTFDFGCDYNYSAPLGDSTGSSLYLNHATGTFTLKP